MKTRRTLAALAIPAAVIAAGLAVSNSPANAFTATPTTPTETAYPVVWVNNDVYSKSVVGISGAANYGQCVTFSKNPATGCYLLSINQAFQDGLPSPVGGVYAGSGSYVYVWHWGFDSYAGKWTWLFNGCSSGPSWTPLTDRWMTVRGFAGSCFGKAAPANAPASAPR